MRYVQKMSTETRNRDNLRSNIISEVVGKEKVRESMGSEAIHMVCTENSFEKGGCKCKQRIMASLKGRREGWESKVNGKKIPKKLEGRILLASHYFPLT